MIRKYKLNNSCTTYVVYNKKKKAKGTHNKDNTIVGTIVYSRYLGWGDIVSISRDLCTIKYGEIKKQCYKDDALRLIEKTTELTEKNENSN